MKTTTSWLKCLTVKSCQQIFIGVLAVITTSPTISLAQGFTYNPPGQLVAGSGTGRVDYTIWSPGIAFPLENTPAYANSQVYGVGGASGSAGTLCDAKNFTMPWSDNYCETRSWYMPLCPSGTGHQGQDIRPISCVNDTHWIVAVEGGTIDGISTSDSSVSVRRDDGSWDDYLHWITLAPGIKNGVRVTKGQRLARVSNWINNTTSTSIHLHKARRKDTWIDLYTKVELANIPEYMSLVRAYQRKVGMVEDSPVLVSAINVSPATTRLLGQSFSVQFTIKNTSQNTVLLRELVLGGRLNGSSTCANYSWSLNACGENVCPDFPHIKDLLLQPNQSYTYTGSFSPNLIGTYRFEVFYRLGDEACSGWRWNVPVGNAGINNSVALNVVNQPAATPTRIFTSTVSAVVTPVNTPVPGVPQFTSTRTATSVRTATPSRTRTATRGSTGTATATPTPTATPNSLITACCTNAMQCLANRDSCWQCVAKFDPFCRTTWDSVCFIGTRGPSCRAVCKCG